MSLVNTASIPQLNVSTDLLAIWTIWRRGSKIKDLNCHILVGRAKFSNYATMSFAPFCAPNYNKVSRRPEVKSVLTGSKRINYFFHNCSRRPRCQKGREGPNLVERNAKQLQPKPPCIDFGAEQAFFHGRFLHHETSWFMIRYMVNDGSRSESWYMMVNKLL